MRNTTIRNKLIYLFLIVAIFAVMIPYSWRLEARKLDSDLGEAQIGRVDTGGFILNLALLGGARGIAANILWMDAQALQKAQEYDKLNARVDFITKLQPHFHSIWTYQGWNLAYNVSVEWDDPKDKYEWVKRGINFLKRGVEKNQKTPDLLWDTAWTYYHKIGFSDEAIYLRQMFHDDTDEDFRRYPDPRNNDVLTQTFDDNFQLGRGWFLRSQKLAEETAGEVASNIGKKIEFVDAPEQHKGKPGDLAFYCMAAHAQTKYSVYLEKASKLFVEPSFGEKAAKEWREAQLEWETFGNREFEGFNDPQKKMVKLIDVLDANNQKRLTETQWYWTMRWGNQMNMPYWHDRSVAEQEKEAVEARRLFHEGRKSLKLGDFPKSVESYKLGLDLWKAVSDRHRNLRDDELNKEDTGQVVNYYLRALKQNGEEVPKDTPYLELGKLFKEMRSVDPFDLLEAVPDTVYQELRNKSKNRKS